MSDCDKLHVTEASFTGMRHDLQNARDHIDVLESTITRMMAETEKAVARARAQALEEAANAVHLRAEEPGFITGDEAAEVILALRVVTL